MMYNKDDIIVYGNTGVCCVADVIMRTDAKTGQQREYYRLVPLFSDCTIYAPVDGSMFMRRVISKEKALELIDKIPSIEAEAYYNTRMQELTQHYQAALSSHSCADLIELTMSIYAKKRIVEQQNRKFGQVDERYMKQAEELLFSEFSVALGIPKQEVGDYISARISAAEKEQQESL